MSEASKSTQKTEAVAWIYEYMGRHVTIMPSVADLCRQEGREVVDLVPADLLDAARAELASVLADWNSIVEAIGSPTNGGAVGRARELRAEHDRLLRFAGVILREHREYGAGDVGGDTVQDAAVSCGLLAPREVSEPCGEACMCDDFPTECLFASDLGKRAIDAAKGSDNG